jgi:hypothetical protein
MDQLWMHRFDQNLPLITAGAMKPGRRLFTFLTSGEPAVMRHCGMDVSSGDIIVHNFDEIYQRTGATFRMGSISLTICALDAACKAMTGREFSGSPLKHLVRPNAALMSRLLMLHEMVGQQIATTVPEVLEVPEAARSLEQQLIHILVRCLTDGVSTQMTGRARRHDMIIAKFEEYLEANPNTPLYLAEICGAIGAAERTLRLACEEHLGPLSRYAKNAPYSPLALASRFFDDNGNENCHRPWVLGTGTFFCQLSCNVWGNAFGNIATTTGSAAHNL